MEPFVTLGLVLREIHYKEADRILTLLTPKLGVISAFAPNSLRMKSKLLSGCGLFCYSEFVLSPGRNMYRIWEADVQTTFYGVSASIEGLSLSTYLSEIASALLPTGEEAEKELRLLLNCLYMISEQKADLRVIKAVFELRTMSQCGFMPQIVCCKGCGEAGRCAYPSAGRKRAGICLDGGVHVHRRRAGRKRRGKDGVKGERRC